MNSTVFKNSERGVALIMAIGFLAVLSILGAVVMKTVTQGIQQTTSYLPARKAFYTADNAVEYALNRQLLISMPGGGTVDLVNDDIPGQPGKKHTQAINSNDSQIDVGIVNDLGPNDLPSNAASLFGDDFSANYYHVEIKSTGPMNTKSNINASIVRLFKRDDDTIFRTSGGG